MTWDRSDIVIVAGGAGIPPSLRDQDVGGRTVVAADAGALAVLDAGWPLHVLVGDLDSIPPHRLDDIRRRAGTVIEHPRDKDATDLALAVAHVVAVSPSSRVLVCGVEGDRPDHHLAALLLCAGPATIGLDVVVALAHGRAHVVRDRLELHEPAGRVVSVIPVHTPAVVTLTGARWPLEHATLAPGTTRGVSNETTETPFAIDVHDGVVLAIVPDPEEYP